MMSTTAERFTILCAFLKNNPKRYAIFVGAGASKSSGLPGGEELKNLVYNEYMTLLRDLQIGEMSCEMLLDKLRLACGNSAVSDLLKKYLDAEVMVPPGYERLVKLVKFQNLSTIVTVNFDELIEDSFQRARTKLRMVTTEDDMISLDRVKEKPTIVKLHGTISKPRTILATIQDVQKLAEWKKEILKFIVQNLGIIFVGYSARDPDILDVIRAKSFVKRRESYNIYWVGPSLSSNAESILKEYDCSNNFFRLHSDSFFELMDKGIKLSNPIKIGVLDGRHLPEGEHVCQPSCSTYQPEAWVQYFEDEERSEKYEICPISASEISDRYVAIINPFGEAYPELHREELITFKSIKEYIKSGGIFVNVGGLAFFYWDRPHRDNVCVERIISYPRRLRIEGDQVFFDLETYVGSLVDNLLSRYFGLRCTLGAPLLSTSYQEREDIDLVGNIVELGGSPQITEFRAVSKNSSTGHVLPLLRSRRNNEEVYPIAAIPVEAGTLIHAGMNVQSDREFLKVAGALDHFIDRERRLLFEELQNLGPTSA